MDIHRAMSERNEDTIREATERDGILVVAFLNIFSENYSSSIKGNTLKNDRSNARC